MPSDDRISMKGLDPLEALRGLLKVKPEDAEDGSDDSDPDSDPKSD